MIEFVLLLAVFAALAIAPGVFAASVTKTPTSTSLESEGKTLWTVVHDPQQGKPYIHPLSSTSASGEVLTGLRPDDHPWHRGVWFSWKFINGVNYWEEDRETRRSDGDTRLLNTQVDAQDDAVVLVFDLAYAPANTDDIVLREQRTLRITHPDADGAYAVHWSSVFTAQDQEVVLDRTPLPGQPDGQSYGGYAGWSVRMSQELLGGQFVNSHGKSDADRESAWWNVYETPQGESLLFMEHPDNLNAPAKWYLAKDMPYFSPAVIHDEPYTIEAHGTLNLRYGLLIHPGKLSEATVDQQRKQWLAETEG